MCVEDLDNVLSPWPKANFGASNTLAYIPVSSPKCSWPSIEGILEHGTLLDRPVTQDGQTATKSTAVVELSIRENLASVMPNGLVVLLRKTFLQGNDMRCRDSMCNSMTYLVKPCNSLGRYVAKTPAVEGQEVDLRGEIMNIIIVDGNGGRRCDMLSSVTCHDHGAGGVCGSNGD